MPQVIYGITTANHKFGYSVLFDEMENDRPSSVFERLVGSPRRIDGMIVLSPQTDDDALWRLIESDFPVVLIGSIRHPEEVSVNFSTRRGIISAARHLVAWATADSG